MNKTSVAFLIALFPFVGMMVGCASQPLTPEQQISKKCGDAGFIGEEFSKCVDNARIAYNKEFEKNEKEYKRQQQERVKAIEAQKKQILEADREKCGEFGFKNGTDAFSSCMMQMARERTQAQERQQEAYQRWQESQPTDQDIAEANMLTSQSFARSPGGYYVSPQDVANHRMNPSIPLPSPPPAAPPAFVPAPVHTSCHNSFGSIECDTQ